MIIRFPENPGGLAREQLVVINDRAGLAGAGSAGDGAILFGAAGSRHCSMLLDAPGNVSVAVSGFFTRMPGIAGPKATPAERLAALYADRRESMLDGVDGTFTFIIIDWDRETVLYGVDRMGIARAYEGSHRGLVAFSDSLHELREALPRGMEVDMDTVRDFLVLGWIPAPYSMFRQVSKLLPGNFVRQENGNRSVTEYYDIRHTPDFTERTGRELTEEIRAHLDRAVQRGTALGGRWGSFLSGGMDSSSVVSSLALVSGEGFPTYFGAFDPELNKYLTIPDETQLAQMVADYCHTDHSVVCLEPDAVDSMDEVVEALEEPVCDGGCLVVAQVLKTGRQDADGLMTGVGGDFLFGGERRHVLVNLMNYTRHVPGPAWTMVRWLFGLLPLLRNARLSQIHFDLNRFLNLRGLDFDRLYERILEGQPVPMDRLLNAGVEPPGRSPVDQIRAYLGKAGELDPLSRILYLDLKMVTPNHCVREVETLGNHYGITTYNPYLDSEFVDFSMTIPSNVKVRGLALKAAMKDAMKGRLPEDIMTRSKGGLGGPTRWWVTRGHGLVEEVLSRDSIRKRGMFDADVVEELRSDTAADRRDYSKLLWSIFTLELWMRRFADGDQ